MSISGVANMDAKSPCVTKSPLGQSRRSNVVFPKTPTWSKDSERMDRFIPSRTASDLEAGFNNMLKENQPEQGAEGNTSPSQERFKQTLAANLIEQKPRVLAFKQRAPAPPEGFENSLRPLYTNNVGEALSRKACRHIPQAQERILDAPDIVDDYYLNLLDWSCKNVIAVALRGSVFLFNAGSGVVDELCELPDGDIPTSLAWAADGNYLGVGTSDHKVQLWDTTKGKQVKELYGHTNRVSSLAWNESILSSGGKDSVVNNWDIRKRRDDACVAAMRGVHQQEVCGLKWAPSGQQLASGGNDNLLCIWDSSGRLQHQITAHQAAVKALAWCPFQANLLASGGGTADRCIKFWNTSTGAMMNSIDTGSQVCALQWNRHEREILSSHGYSRYQLCLWKYPSMAKIAELTGHTQRVLHMATSPDGGAVVSAGADETLRFWKVFGEPVAKDAKSTAGRRNEMPLTGRGIR